MPTLLQIKSSLFAENSQSSRLSDQFVAAWRVANPSGKVIVRDLAANAMPHLTGERFGAFLAKPEDRTPEQQLVVNYSDALIDELRNADVVTIGLPMYNFGIPSTLKAYFDHIARSGVTFQYTANGPQGLLTGKKVVIFAARGGAYVGTPMDTQTGYVRDFLRFLGMSDVEFVYAEGLAMGEDSKQAAIANAEKAIRVLVEPLRAAA